MFSECSSEDLHVDLIALVTKAKCVHFICNTVKALAYALAYAYVYCNICRLLWATAYLYTKLYIDLYFTNTKYFLSLALSLSPYLSPPGRVCVCVEWR